MIKPSMQSRAQRPPIPRRVPRRILRPIHARAAARQEEVDDYDGEAEPNMKFSHALIVVLILHIVAVGGVIAFNMLKTKAPASAKQKAPVVEKQDARPTDARTAAKSDAKSDVKPAAKPSASEISYAVVAGDTLRKIALKQKSSVDAIEQANGLESGATLHIGQVLKIPVKAGAAAKDPAPATRTAPPKESAPVTKTAPPKDPPAAAKSAPEKDPAPAVKPAAPKDPAPAAAAKTAPTKDPAPAAAKTAEAKPAAPRADAPAAKAAPAEDAKPAASPAPAATKPAETKPAASGTTYTVAKGDNPYSIAKKLNVSYGDLLKANKIDDPKKLQIGQKLIVP
jgi:LysM repeat protein